MLPLNRARNSAGIAILWAAFCANALTPPQAPAGPEKQLFDLVNQERANAQLPPLEWDAGLARAAHAHAVAMAAAHELTHQLKNELSMPVRLTEATTLRLDAEGENVALNVSVSGAHQGLMHSPPHRENILDPHFNYAGFATVWDKGQLWVVQDFAHAMSNDSSDVAEQKVARAIARVRRDAGLPALRQTTRDDLRDVACGMGRADNLQTTATRELAHQYSVATYTQTDLSVIAVQKLVQRPDLREFSVGVCFMRTKTYPGGTYWVVALFY